MKVAIVIITYNIETRVFLLQVEAIQKFCKDDFEIHVFDNSYNKKVSEGIKYHSDLLGVEYKKIKSGSKNSSDSHCFGLKFAYQSLCDKFEYFLFLDHDCIPVKSFSVVDTLETKIMGGIGQGAKAKYLWVGCLFMNTTEIDKELIDFNYSHELGLDSGGNLHKVIDKYGGENFLFFDELYCELDGFTGKHGWYTLINDGMFCHWSNASNWEGIDRHEERMNALLNITKEMIDAVD